MQDASISQVVNVKMVPPPKQPVQFTQPSAQLQGTSPKAKSKDVRKDSHLLFEPYVFFFRRKGVDSFLVDAGLCYYLVFLFGWYIGLHQSYFEEKKFFPF
jgi:hypothetical protein